MVLPTRRIPFLCLLILIFCLLDLGYCQPSIEEDPRCEASITCDPSEPLFAEQDQISIKYANSTIRDINYSNTYVDFTVVFKIDDGKIELPYRLIQCGCEIPEDTSDTKTILFTNPTNVYVSDGPSLAMFTELFNISEQFPVKYVYNEEFIYSKRIRDAANADPPSIFSFLGNNWELLRQEDDMSMGFISSSPFTYASAIEGFKENYTRPLLVIGEVSEVSPLARAEWMKVIGLIFNRANQVNSLFDKIVAGYEDAKEKASFASRRPSVLFNYPYFYGTGGTDLDRYSWTQPGPQQYVTDLLRDANADYRYNYKDGGDTGHFVLFTQVVKEFQSARFIINSEAYDNGYKNLTISDYVEQASADNTTTGDFTEAMRGLLAVRCSHVWGRIKRLNGAASDIFESAIARPDLVLKDYVKILHPDVNIGDHQIYYMSQYVSTPEDNLTCPYVNILGNPSQGIVFIDKELEVQGLDRFQVQDALESNVYPELGKRDITNKMVDVQFREAAVKNEETVRLFVRVRTSADNETVSSSTDVVDAFQAGLQSINSSVRVTEIDTEVKQAPTATPTPSSETATPTATTSSIGSVAAENETPTASPAEAVQSPESSEAPVVSPSPSPSSSSSSSSSLSGGAIAGIVIAVLVVVIVVAIIARRVIQSRSPAQADPFTG